ncbi:MFS transporter [Rhizobium sp. Root274]|uniref:DHA2 family efflux MFS transporter permease subunit n=1 Tax=unclassified Rhizobium TaxID=2613769 RepID=UPI0007160F3F|nr:MULTISPECIES: DHA2 family efflux MFS transporter permease subunit [unclassified Rhizobium]KQW30012.1 MFS transporter [Rhizobium sp. Root1240]KRD30656.1 MFS transporter [Rhizobium sp. Root274]
MSRPPEIAAVTSRSPLAVWAGFIAMCIGMFMAILDVQVVATSLPTIQGALDIPPDQMSWIQTAYLTAEIIAIPLTGVLTRFLGMRWLFVTAIAVFTVASIGCAASGSFTELVAWRVLQGFSGGTLIPAVFSAVFILFPVHRQGLATTIAGVLAVLAPTVGPIVGGWLTATYSWHWLFLINVVPGILSALAAALYLPHNSVRLHEFRRLDTLSLVLLAVALTALELGLKQAPTVGWLSGPVPGLLALSTVTATLFVMRTLAASHPIVDLHHFANRNFVIGSTLSFVLGIGLFGSVYLMPVFLAFVRGHDAFQIGMIMLVTGIAQLLTAPVAVALEQRVDARLLSAFGFALFASGLGWSVFQTPETDFAGMLWPQIIRGVAIMFCLLPPTRLALGNLPQDRVPDASGLFNLMRNLGGAIGLALIDTVIYIRSPMHIEAITAALQARDMATAHFVGVPLDQFTATLPGPLSEDMLALIDPLVQNAATTQAINEAWGMIACLNMLALFCVPFARRILPAGDHDAARKK